MLRLLAVTSATVQMVLSQLVSNVTMSMSVLPIITTAIQMLIALTISAHLSATVKMVISELGEQLIAMILTSVRMIHAFRILIAQIMSAATHVPVQPDSNHSKVSVLILMSV